MILIEDYCSFEIAKLLKEKGFDEVCTRVYIEIEGRWGNYPYQPTTNSQMKEVIGIMCPTHQMAIKWLRERHIIIVIVPEYFESEQCASWDIDIWVDGDYNHPFEDYPTYEEAVEAALKYCLTKLI